MGTVKVKYNGEKFKTNIRDKIKINGIKFWLLLKRTKRRFVVAVPKNILLYLFMIIFWGIFIIFTYMIGNIYKAPDPYTWLDVIWDLKASIFTSIFLAIVIVSYSQIVEYQKTIKEQYSLYINTLETFDRLPYCFMQELDETYLPFYTSKTVEDTLTYLEDHDYTNYFYDDVYFDVVLTDIQDQLNEIQKKMESGTIIGMNKKILEDNIGDARKLIRFVSKKHEEISFDVIKNLISYLSNIIKNIRWPWRWDRANNGKILEILFKYDENDIDAHYYYKMQYAEYEYEKTKGEVQ